MDSHHQLLLLPLRKEQNSDYKQINNTCRGTDKALQQAAFDAAALKGFRTSGVCGFHADSRLRASVVCL